MERRRFLGLVRRALDELPEPYRGQLANINVVVERRPRSHHLRDAGLDPGETLFGLYEGVPLIDRTSDYGMVPPDTITIFQEPLEREYLETAELEEEVRRTVLHELAHYFGSTDEELERLGLD